MPPGLVVGLTGGLASGKSTVARLFEAKGVPILDADVVGREVVAPGEPALAEIRQRFGGSVIRSDGQLDRARLRERVFADDAERHALEEILHPKIRRRLRDRLHTLDAPYAILVIPLLLETQGEYGVDRVLVVDTPRALQLERAAARDGSPRRTLEAMLDAQVDRDTRLAQADDVIVNDGTLEALRTRVEQLHERYSTLAARLRRAAQQ